MLCTVDKRTISIFLNFDSHEIIECYVIVKQYNFPVFFHFLYLQTLMWRSCPRAYIPISTWRHLAMPIICIWIRGIVTQSGLSATVGQFTELQYRYLVLLLLLLFLFIYFITLLSYIMCFILVVKLFLVLNQMDHSIWKWGCRPSRECIIGWNPFLGKISCEMTELFRLSLLHFVLFLSFSPQSVEGTSVC